ncbi:MAG TPA: two-component regulator propeller domain-containing protein [Flavisolibacter sp.]|jgi:ligand-binding sensor domain-containing protein|nr:two-component regulator propeller domain-containing protein [Flavisolibacter sp.]
MPLKHLFGLFVSFFFLTAALGQQSEQFVFTHYRLADGLASNIVNNVVQDEQGFIWLSTHNGLQRFDGNKFITFKSTPGRSNTLPADEVAQVYIDRKKNLWVLTADNKAGIFNTQTFSYREVPIREESREKLHIEKTFLETPSGELLLHFRKSAKLFQYDEKANAFVPSSLLPFPGGRPVNYIYHDKVSQAFLLSTDSGLVVRYVNSPGSQSAEMSKLLKAAAGERYLNYLHIDGSRQLFFEQWPKEATHPVLKVFDPKTGRKKQIDLQMDYGLGYHQIRAILEQRNGRRWIYGLPFIAGYTNAPGNLQFLKKDYNKEKELKFNQVHSMYEDRQQNIWVCTDYGVYLFNPDAQLFHNYTLTTPNRFKVEGKAQTALQLANGELWIGYRDLGLFRYERNMHPLPLHATLAPLVDMRSVWDLHRHSKTGNIWITMQGGSLVVFDSTKQRAQLLTPPACERRAITQVTEDQEGNLWLGTQGGNLVKWDYKAGAKDLAAGFSLAKRTGVVEKLFTDSEGYIWVATVGEGLLKINPRTSRVITQLTMEGAEGFRLWNNNPRDVIQYNDSLLIVAGGVLNLVNLHTNAVTHITNRDGLPSHTVQSLAKDREGLVWIGTMNGLCVTDLAKQSFTVYDQRDGLLNDQFNVTGAHRLRDGSLLFTTLESFVIFDPSFVQRKQTTGKASITGFTVMNKSLSVDSLLRLKRIDLAYNNNYVAIEFSAFNYSQLTKLDYYYQLQGFDTTWIRSDNHHQAIYSYLPPGKYQFRIKTKNLAGEESPEVAYLNIRVHPPFWLTWWFFCILVAVVSVVLYILYRERIKRLVSLQNVRSDIASHLHKDVSITLNNINVLSHIAKLKADKDIVRSKELIDEISGKSHNMMMSMDEILWSIDPVNDTMEKTLVRIFEYARTLESSFDTTIDIMVHDKVKHLRLNMKVRHNFFIVCKAVLQYLAQYAANKSILVDIDLVWSKIVLKVLRTGDETDGSREQMLELKERLQQKAGAINASLDFEVGKRDTSIVLSIPVK